MNARTDQFLVLYTGINLFYRRPIEERVVHALGKAWHVEVMIYLIFLLFSFKYTCRNLFKYKRHIFE